MALFSWLRWFCSMHHWAYPSEMSFDFCIKKKWDLLKGWFRDCCIILQSRPTHFVRKQRQNATTYVPLKWMRTTRERNRQRSYVSHQSLVKRTLHWMNAAYLSELSKTEGYLKKNPQHDSWNCRIHWVSHSFWLLLDFYNHRIIQHKHH